MAHKEKPNLTGELQDALRLKYPRDAYALLYEVRNTTGFGGGVVRTADAIAMSLWPSRGLELLGFEIKSHRGDWLAELKQPEKAEAIFRFCDRWWIVAAKGVVKDGELPPTWGLMVLSKSGLRVKVPAPKLEPVQMTLGFIASLFRSEQKPGVERIEREVAARLAAALKEHGATTQRSAKMMVDENESLKQVISDFEKSSGVKIRSAWRHDRERTAKIGEAVKHALNGGSEAYHRELAGLEEKARQIHTRIKNALVEKHSG